MNTKGHPGRMSKTVEIWTNDPEKKMLTLTIAGEVLPEPPRESEGGRTGKSGGDCGSN